MKIVRESIGHYVHMMERGRRFSMAGYSDAEWYCVLGQRAGELTGLGQVLCPEHGQLLADVLQRRQHDPRWVTAVPSCLFPSTEGPGLPGFAEGQVDWWLGSRGIVMQAQERDRITDDLAREGDLAPFIRRVRQMRPALIGPAALDPKRHLAFLNLRRHIVIDTPNLHMERVPGCTSGIDRAVEQALEPFRRGAAPMVWLVSAGVSAAVIIDRLHDRLPDCWLIDCGSIWDAFAGIGGQRQWRADLYADPAKWEQWKRHCIEGKR